MNRDKLYTKLANYTLKYYKIMFKLEDLDVRKLELPSSIRLLWSWLEF